MNDKSARIKNIVTKIDLDKIASYLQEHSKSKTLKEIIKYSKRILDSNDDKKVFKLAVDTAYNLTRLIILRMKKKINIDWRYPENYLRIQQE